MRSNNYEIILITALFTLVSYGLSSQTIVENQIDEFTNQSIKRTSWEPLSKNMNGALHFRISQINSHYFLDLKMIIGQGGSVFSIGENDELMFKFMNGEVIKMMNKKFTITCEGCGAVGFIGSTAQGIQVSYPLNEDQVKLIVSNNIEKIRVYRTKDYIEESIKPKYADSVKIALSLLQP